MSFSVLQGQNLCLMGESGSGKSTLLKLLYGLYDLDEGSIFWNDVEVLGPKYNLVPGMDFMKYLAQDFDLMPFISVAENIGKYLSNFYPEAKQLRINELLELVEMTDFASVKVKYLSGGQMQRVALARVLALEPEVLLLDEPFSHIDNTRKNNLRRNIFNYAKIKGITCIVGTHDIEDALSFADQMIVLNNGKIVAQNTPFSLFNSKEDITVVKLFGDVNSVPATYFDEIDSLDLLFYPFELFVVEKSKLKVEVICSYFKGRNYLIEAKYTNGTLFFEHPIRLQKGDFVFLDRSTNQNI